MTCSILCSERQEPESQVDTHQYQNTSSEMVTQKEKKNDTNKNHAMLFSLSEGGNLENLGNLVVRESKQISVFQYSCKENTV